MSDAARLLAVMQQLAKVVETAASAKAIMDNIPDQDSKITWAAAWGIELIDRLTTFRLTDPTAPLPTELASPALLFRP